MLERTSSQPQKLHLGCGDDLREGYLNTDGFFIHPDVERLDMLALPWRFKDESFDEVLANHVFEHIPVVIKADGRDILFHLMEEIWRVLRPGGVLEIATPKAGTIPAVTHIQHYRQFWRGWEHPFMKGGVDSHLSTARFELVSQKDQFHSVPYRNGSRLQFAFPIRGLPFQEHLKVRFPPLHRLLFSLPGETRTVLSKLV